MIGRRELLFLPLALGAQSRRPRVAVVWGPAPPELARDAVVFPRAYACCPQPELARRAVETGKFPHASSPEDPVLGDLLAGGGTDAITVFTTASGDGQDSPYERSVRVPLAIRWPGRLVPRTASEILISHVDLLPTLLGLAGVPPPEGLQGRDLSALLVTRQGDLPDSVYAEGRLGQSEEWRMVVRGFDKIVFNLQEEVLHLYNLADDPHEERDLAQDRDHELTRDAMLALARVWMRRLGDGVDPSGLRKRP